MQPRQTKSTSADGNVNAQTRLTYSRCVIIVRSQFTRQLSFNQGGHKIRYKRCASSIDLRSALVFTRIKVVNYARGVPDAAKDRGIARPTA